RGGSHADISDRGRLAPGGNRESEVAEKKASPPSGQQGYRRVDAGHGPDRLGWAAGNGRPRLPPADEGVQVILPDVNVLIYAFRYDLPQHPVCRRLNGFLGPLTGWRPAAP